MCICFGFYLLHCLVRHCYCRSGRVFAGMDRCISGKTGQSPEWIAAFQEKLVISGIGAVFSLVGYLYLMLQFY